MSVDDRLRELERRARAGDAEAAARLARERDRAGGPEASVSTRRLDLLPHPEELRRRWSALALLHVLLDREAELEPPGTSGEPAGYLDFRPRWGDDLQAGIFDNGQGDSMFAVFAPAGVYLQGFDHESPMTPFRKRPPVLWPGLHDGLPVGLAEFVDEPSFEARQRTTFLVWWDAASPGWRTGVTSWHARRDPDGSEDLLGRVAGHLALVRAHLNLNFEDQDVELSAPVLQAVLEHARLTPELVQALRPGADLALVAAWARSLGYGSPWPFAWS